MKTSDLSARQQQNCLSIIVAALPFGGEAIAACLMAAAAESSWLRYANDGSTTRVDVPVKWRQLAATSMNYPHDAVAGSAWTTADSVGLYQQRAMYGYGTIAELMDPAESTRIFIRGSNGGKGTTKAFLNAPKNLTLPQKVQWTQGSEFPTGDNYAPFVQIAQDLIQLLMPTAPISAPSDWFASASLLDVAKAVL